MEQSKNTDMPVSTDGVSALIHYLNNSLAVVAGHCELLADHLEPGSEAAGRLRQILQTVHGMAAKINGHDCRKKSSTDLGGCFRTIA